MAEVDPTVRAIMIENPRTVLPQAPAVRAAQIMVQSRIRHLIVAENHEEVVGVLSERQILKHFSPWLAEMSEGERSRTAPPRCEAQEIMATPPITATIDTSIRAAAAVLASKKLGCLPVVGNHNHLVGLVTSVDVLRYIGRDQVPRPGDEFRVFRPSAFLGKDGRLTVPVGYFPKLKADEEILAVLAFAARSKRIGVKLFPRGDEAKAEELYGARPATVSDKYVAIPAEDFLNHYGLDIRGPLEVTEDRETGYFILSPVLSPFFHGPVDHR